MKQKRVVGLLLFVVLLLSAAVVWAQPVDPDSTLIPLQMRILENGLRVIVKEIPSYPIATVNMWVNAGSKDDPAGLSGMAHFFEHLMFKGTPSRPVGEISRQVESLGGMLNAATSLDFTTYYIIVPSDHVGTAMEIQADAIRNSVFDPVEVDRERMVIHEEIRLGKDSIQNHLLHTTVAELFANTVYARPIAGTEEELANVTREEILNFHARYYVPNNMVLVVAGKVDADEIFAMTEKLYGDMPTAPFPAFEYISPPVLEGVVYWDEERPIQQSYVLLAFPAPGENTRDAAALTMAAIILGEGRASRLYRRLVEQEGLVNSVSTSYIGFADAGVFGIWAELDPANREQFIQAVRDELQRLHTEPVSEAELGRARAMARSSLAFATESSANVAMFLGKMELYGGVMGAVNRSATLEQITSQDIQRAAQLYLKPEAYVHGEIKPEGGNDQ